MPIAPDGTAWSCFSKGPSLEDALTYGDVPGERYEYDSNVINHARIAIGDILVMRDAELIYGFGVVEGVDTWRTTKIMPRCRECGSAKLTRRRVAQPAYRCHRGHTFDTPLNEPKDVTAYCASYGGQWFPFPSPTPVRALASVYANNDRQNAIRPLHLARVRELVSFHGGVEPTLYLQLRAQGAPIPGGRIDIVVKQRIGQQKFRERLLDRFGSVCAVTGSQPEEVLDAAHLFTFAERPEHVETAGLLLRADVHRLFDRLLLTIEPHTWQSRVAPPLLERYPLLADLHGRDIDVAEARRPDPSYLEEHWGVATQRWKRLAAT